MAVRFLNVLFKGSAEERPLDEAPATAMLSWRVKILEFCVPGKMERLLSNLFTALDSPKMILS